MTQVGAPEPELDEDGFSPPGSSFSPSPSPRGLLPEGSFVDESGRVLGPGGSSPMGTLGAPCLDARLVAVFSPRSMPSRPGSAGMTTQAVCSCLGFLYALYMSLLHTLGHQAKTVSSNRRLCHQMPASIKPDTVARQTADPVIESKVVHRQRFRSAKPSWQG